MSYQFEHANGQIASPPSASAAASSPPIDVEVSEPFIEMAKRGDLAGIKKALSEGVDINFQGRGGWTAIDFAAYYGQMPVLDFLLNDERVCLTLKNDFGFNLLHLAVYGARREMILYLLERASNGDQRIRDQINKTDCKGRTPLMLAEEKKLTDIVRRLTALPMPLQYFFREAQPPSKISPFPQGTQATLDFFSAAKKGDLNGVRQAIAKGADINYPISVKWRGIDSAAYRGYITVVAFLLDAPYINLTAEDNINHWTLMHFAVHGQQFKMVEYLLNRALSGDRRIQIDKKSQKGNTPLMAAKIEGFSEISDILEAATRQLAATLDFFSAAKKGDLNEVRQTIAEGADINYQNDGSWRAIDYAVQYGHMSVVIFLLETPHLKLAAEDDNKWGWTWMHQAVAGNQVNMVEYLLRRVRSRDWRIQIDKKTKSGKTPLMMATTKGFREIIGLLARIPNPPTGAASPPSAGAAASSLIPPRAASMPREWMTSASPLVSPLSTPVPGVAKGEELINLNNNDLWSKLKDDACERPAEEAGRSLLYKSMLSSYTNQRSDLPPQRDAKPFLEEEDKREDDEL